MFDTDPIKGSQFMEAFFNPLENDLPKGNSVDAVRQELVVAIASAQRDLTRPIFIRRALMNAFKEFVAGTVRTKWSHFLNTPEKRKAIRQRKQVAAAAVGRDA